MIVERVRRRLQGWKAKSLSMAGRITLVKSAVSSMALYTMQHDRIPQGIIEEIERDSRRFVWGEEGNCRKWHAISWERMCSPKEEGGVGIKNLRGMNEAFFYKALWRMHSNPGDLWAQVLHGKYGRNRRTDEKLIVKGGDSRLWKEMAKQWEAFRNITELRINQEEGQGELADTSSRPEWKLKWKLSKDGEFNTKSAYQHTQLYKTGEKSPVWMRIWKLWVPERVKVFAWQMVHRRLATKEVTRRWDEGSGVCTLCGLHIEDQIHALRDCPQATQIWRGIVPVEKRAAFFGAEWLRWIELNIMCRRQHAKESWTEVFVVMCWLIWKWRNKSIHEENFEMPQNGHLIAYQIVKSGRERMMNNLIHETRCEQIQIKWQPPPSSWCKLNTDGWSGGKGNGGCGGVIRGDCGEWIRGFSLKLQNHDAIEAEIMGLIEGLDLCWELGFRQVVAETDAKEIVEACLGKKHILGYTHLQRNLNKLLAKQWKVRLQHTYREGNRCADRLAALCLGRDNCRKTWTTPPEELLSILEEDISGPPSLDMF